MCSIIMSKLAKSQVPVTETKKQEQDVAMESEWDTSFLNLTFPLVQDSNHSVFFQCKMPFSPLFGGKKYHMNIKT